jgi:methionine-rich copper-binding protein CopC
VDKADAQVDPTHRVVIRVSLQPLAPGDYKVVWRAVSIDTHVTEGDFAFHVRP